MGITLGAWPGGFKGPSEAPHFGCEYRCISVLLGIHCATVVSSLDSEQQVEQHARSRTVTVFGLRIRSERHSAYAPTAAGLAGSDPGRDRRLRFGGAAAGIDVLHDCHDASDLGHRVRLI